MAVLYLLGENIVTASANRPATGNTHFGEEGANNRAATPDTRTLLQYGAFYIGSADDKVLYLTFDAGYENGC